VTSLVSLSACGHSPAPQSLHTQTTAPTNGAAVYDAARRVVVLVTQTADTTNKYVQTWSWDGRLWTLQPVGVSPTSRNSELLAYDPERRVTVLYGGNGEHGQWLTDTWEWSGSKWVRRTTADAPPETQAGFGSMAYDPVTHLVLLFQWGHTSQSQWVNQTWTWDGKDWKLWQTAHTPLLIGGTLVFDGHRLILVGDTSDGDRSETWGWDGSDWSLLSSAVSRGFASPPAALDTRKGGVVTFGGGPGDDTWLWNGSDWTRAHPKQSPDGTPQPLVYDEALQRVVGFAGVGQITGIYEWTGTDWIAVGSGSRPAIAAGRAVVPPAQAISLIRQTVTGAQPILFPTLPSGVDQAWFRADQYGFDLRAANDDRSIQIDLAIVVPGNSNLGAANKNIPFRGAAAYYQYIAGDPTGWRDLWWVERPGHWTGEPGLKGGDGVPYVLSANGLSESDFFGLAASLS
jgi:hypothetical protein